MTVGLKSVPIQFNMLKRMLKIVKILERQF